MIESEMSNNKNEYKNTANNAFKKKSKFNIIENKLYD